MHNVVQVCLAANTVNLLLSPPPPRGLFISSPFEVGLYRAAALFNLEKTMVSVLHRKLRIQSREAQEQEVRGHAAKARNQVRISSL